MLLQLGWRNIWRNSRRTLVILTAVIIGVWSMICLSGIMRGMLAEMIRDGIATLTGHIQVHHSRYHEDPAVENSIEDPGPVLEILKQAMPEGSRLTTRIRVNAVLSSARHSAGVVLVGIQPEKEAQVSFIGQAVKQGRYLNRDDPTSMVIGHSLAKKFKARIGQKLILMSQDTTKEIRSKAFKIVGFFRAAMEATEDRYVFVTQPSAQEMLRLNESISEVALTLPSVDDVSRLKEDLARDFPSSQYQVMDWKERLPLLKAYLEMMETFQYLWYLVVVIAMGFGIVNTMLMAVYERMHEFGLMKALGMRPAGIIGEVIVEAFFVLMIGTVVGNALGLVTVFWLNQTGIDLTSLAAGTEYWGMPKIIHPSVGLWDILNADLMVFLLGILVCLYPAVKAARFTPVEALTRT
jgi:ABC-type lipoprotein release transport system permease subunit